MESCTGLAGYRACFVLVDCCRAAAGTASAQSSPAHCDWLPKPGQIGSLGEDERRAGAERRLTVTGEGPLSQSTIHAGLQCGNSGHCNLRWMTWERRPTATGYHVRGAGQPALKRRLITAHRCVRYQQPGPAATADPSLPMDAELLAAGPRLRPTWTDSAANPAPRSIWWRPAPPPCTGSACTTQAGVPRRARQSWPARPGRSFAFDSRRRKAYDL
jgi:hypothetical protein